MLTLTHFQPTHLRSIHIKMGFFCAINSCSVLTWKSSIVLSYH